MANTSTLDRPAGGNCGLPAQRMIEISFDDRAFEEVGTDLRFVMPIAIFGGGLIVVTPVFVWPRWTTAWFVFAGIALVAYCVAAYYSRRIWRYVMSTDRLKRVDEICEEIKTLGVGEAVRRAIWEGRGAMLLVAEKSIRAIHAAGMGPYALRMCRNRHAGSLEPLKRLFEPTPLDEAGDGFPTLELDGARSCEVVPSDGASLRQQMMRRIRRNLRVAAAFGLLLGFSIQFVSGVAIAIQSRGLNWQSWWWRVVIPMLVLAIVVALPRGSLMHWRRQWFVVPGGVIVRRSGWLDRAWRVHCFRRDTAVLFVHESARGEWRAQVGDGEQVELEYMTRREAALLLRAWLSPLEPPQAAMMSDLV